MKAAWTDYKKKIKKRSKCHIMHEQVNYTVRWDQSYTLARSCFKARKTSRFLKDLNSAKSSGKHNAFFRHSAIKLELPFLESLRLALSSAELLELRVKMGLQIEAFLGRSEERRVGKEC